jgi:hypothetical protein
MALGEGHNPINFPMSLFSASRRAKGWATKDEHALSIFHPFSSRILLELVSLFSHMMRSNIENILMSGGRGELPPPTNEAMTCMHYKSWESLVAELIAELFFVHYN